VDQPAFWRPISEIWRRVVSRLGDYGDIRVWSGRIDRHNNSYNFWRPFKFFDAENEFRRVLSYMANNYENMAILLSINGTFLWCTGHASRFTSCYVTSTKPCRGGCAVHQAKSASLINNRTLRDPHTSIADWLDTGRTGKSADSQRTFNDGQQGVSEVHSSRTVDGHKLSAAAAMLDSKIVFL